MDSPADPYETMRQDLGRIRHRVRTIEGTLKDLELIDMARQVVAIVDRLGRSVDDLEREMKKARRLAREDDRER